MVLAGAISSGCETVKNHPEEEEFVEIAISSMYDTVLEIAQNREDFESHLTRTGCADAKSHILMDNFIGDTELCLSTIGFTGEELQKLRTEFGDAAFAFVGLYILSEEMESNNKTRSVADNAMDCLMEATGATFFQAMITGATDLTWKVSLKKGLKLMLKTSAKFLNAPVSFIMLAGEWGYCMTR